MKNQLIINTVFGKNRKNGPLLLLFISALGVQSIFQRPRRLGFIISLTLFNSLFTSAQTVLLSTTSDGGFETGTTFTANGWTAVNSGRSLWEVEIGAVHNSV